MSFQTISVKEAMDRINATNNGWFLPAVQRPYVWGSRHESEKYICKLFDSLLRGYPIGTLIIWNSDKEIPYRLFIDNYRDNDTSPFVDKSLWNREDKWLVYDGQQRLQTLYSCLKHTLNGRILTYDLFFDIMNPEDTDANGFKFYDKNAPLAQGVISVPQLFIQAEDSKVKFRKDLEKTIPDDIMHGKDEDFENIIDKLWDIFVRQSVKSLAYFPIDKTWEEDRVNDVFQRLNMGGVPLSGADLLLSLIKEKVYDYEERLQDESKQIETITQGYLFEPSSILQLVHLIIKGTIRIAPERVKKDELLQFVTVFDELKPALDDFFRHFLYEAFGINNKSIVARGGALFPLLAYVYNRSKKGVKFVKIESDNLLKMKQFFILSQINDWNTQTIIHSCSDKTISADKDFPLDEIKEIISKNNRKFDIDLTTLEEYTWFPLKILMPERSFISSAANQGRYKPEIDHIFPSKLENRPAEYDVDVLWNMQPITGVINASKNRVHPKKFFELSENRKFLELYDFLPDDLSSPLWDNHELFIAERKTKMLKFLLEQYGIAIAGEPLVLTMQAEEAPIVENHINTNNQANVETLFFECMRNIYFTAKKEIGYTATRFMQLLSDVGGVQAAKRLIAKDGGTYGFEVLWEKHRLDLSVEALVLDSRFAKLFTDEEKNMCKARLIEYGYAPK